MEKTGRGRGDNERRDKGTMKGSREDVFRIKDKPVR